MAANYKAWISRELADLIQGGIAEFTWPEGFTIIRIEDVLEHGVKEIAYITDLNAPESLEGQLVSISFTSHQDGSVTVQYP
jgi:hypothetical protein